MATADLDFNLEINGTPDEIIAIIEVMRQYDAGKDGVYFSFTHVEVGDETIRCFGEDTEEKLREAIRSAEKPVIINASGPYGSYGELNDVDIFCEMAEAAPAAGFQGAISGFAGYADQSLTARLEDGKLHISTYYLSDDVRSDANCEYIASCLPYEEFIALFRLDADEYTCDMYEEFVAEHMADEETPAEFFEETDYEEFIELLGAECPLTEEEYSQAVQELSVTEYEDYEEFMERQEYADCEEFTYDPIKKEYIGAGGPVLKANTAYDVTDTIREYLQVAGLPCDDDAIDALSVDDVYAILAGTYGKESGEEDGEDTEDTTEDTDSESAEETAADTAPVCDAVLTEQKTEPAEAAKEAEADAAPRKKTGKVWIAVLIAVIILAAIAALACPLCETPGLPDEGLSGLVDRILNAICRAIK